MRCGICRHGETAPGVTTVVLTRGSTTVVFKDVPADVCDTCGEGYVAAPISATLLQRAEQAEHDGAEIEVVRYAA